MVDSYETIDFLRKQKIKLGNATYIVNSHFLEQGQTLKEKSVRDRTRHVARRFGANNYRAYAERAIARNVKNA